MSINRNSFWGCYSTPKPGPSLSPTQPLDSPKGTPGMDTSKLLCLDVNAFTTSSVLQYDCWPGAPTGSSAQCLTFLVSLPGAAKAWGTKMVHTD